MMQESTGDSTLLLARVGVGPGGPGHAHAPFPAASLARLDEYLPGHLWVVNPRGQLFGVLLGSEPHQSVITSQYEVFLAAAGDQTPAPVHRPWSCFVCQEDGIIFAHAASCNMLFVQLPEAVDECNGAFLFGRHSSEVSCMTRKHNVLLSGARDGDIKLWNTASGELQDSCQPTTSTGRVTCLEFFGPFMVAAGDSLGHVTLFDTASQKLMPISRFLADNGPVTCLSGCVTWDQERQVAAATGARGPDGGGVVQGSVGLAWRSYPYNVDAPPATGTTSLLAVASPAGWLHVYQAAGSGEHAWRRQYSGALPGSPCMEFTPQGDYLMLVSGVVGGGEVMLLHSTTWTCAHRWGLPGSGGVLAAGLLHPTGDLAVIPDLLMPALKLSVYVCPQAGLPFQMQVKVPISDRCLAGPLSRDARAALLGEAAADLEQPQPGSVVLQPAASGSDSMRLSADWLAAADGRAGQQGGSVTCSLDASSLPAATGAAATGAEAGAGGSSFTGFQPRVIDTFTADGASGSAPAPRLTLRPSTQPQSRSWLQGGLPPAPDLSDVLNPPAQQGSSPRSETFDTGAAGHKDTRAQGQADADVPAWQADADGRSGSGQGGGWQGAWAQEEQEQGQGRELLQQPQVAGGAGGDRSSWVLFGEPSDVAVGQHVPHVQGVVQDSQRDGSGFTEDGKQRYQDRDDACQWGEQSAGYGESHTWQDVQRKLGEAAGFKSRGFVTQTGRASVMSDDEAPEPRAVPAHVMAVSRRTTAESASTVVGGDWANGHHVLYQHYTQQAGSYQQQQQHGHDDDDDVQIGQQESYHQQQHHHHHAAAPESDQEQTRFSDDSAASEVWARVQGDPVQGDPSVANQQELEQRYDPAGGEAEAASDICSDEDGGDRGRYGAADDSPHHTFSHTAHSVQGSATLDEGLEESPGAGAQASPRAVDDYPSPPHDFVSVVGSCAPAPASSSPVPRDARDADKAPDVQGVQGRWNQPRPVAAPPESVTHRLDTHVLTMSPGTDHVPRQHPPRQQRVYKAEEQGAVGEGGRGQEGGGVRGGRQPVGVVLSRSPYRGYKPNMAVLLKELRYRNAAGRKGSGTACGGGGGGGGGPSRRTGSEATRLAGVEQQQAARDVREVADQYHTHTRDWQADEQGDQHSARVNLRGGHQTRGMSTNTSLFASPMMIGSPTSTGLRGEMQGGHSPTRAGGGGGGGGNSHVQPGQRQQQQHHFQQQPQHNTDHQADQGMQQYHVAQPFPGQLPNRQLNYQQMVSAGGRQAGQGVHDLAGPQLNSTLNVLGAMKALTLEEGGRAPVQLTPHEQAEVIRRAATLTTNIPASTQLYTNLQTIGAAAFAPKPNKQLHPDWVASRSAKPDIRQLWDPEEYQREVVSTRGVALYTRPTPQEVAAGALTALLL